MRPKQLSPEAKVCLMRYQWPGNIRELENALEHAIVLGSSNTILPDDLPEAIVEIGSPALPLNAHYHAVIQTSKSSSFGRLSGRLRAVLGSRKESGDASQFFASVDSEFGP